MLEFNFPERAGLLPLFADERDPRPLREQLDKSYAHGGGWLTFHGFELGKRGYYYELRYPGDPAMREVARAPFRDQTLVLFKAAWVAIIEADGVTFEVSRMD